MASEKRPPSGSPRRRRPAPTIDLKATEVAVEPVATPAPSAAEPSPSPAAITEPESASPPPPNPPGDRPRQQAEPEPPRPGIAFLPYDVPWPLIAAGATGAAAVLVVVLLIWLITPRRGDAVAALGPRLAAIETQLREVAARPAPSVDPAALNALTDRLGKLEAAMTTRPQPAADPALAQRVGALEGGVKPQNDTVAALTRRADETDAALRSIRSRIDAAAATLAELQNTARTTSADHGEIAKLADRVATLEKADRALAEQLAKNAAAAGSDRPARFAMTAAALRGVVERGDPFATELAAVKPLAGDTAALSALEPFAATGVPSAAALGRELLVLLPVMQRAAGSTREGGFLDRLQANAERLVRIRPVDEVPGEDVTAVLSRIEVKAAHGDIAGTVAELAKLPPAVRTPATDWIAKAQARNQAVEASRRLAADAVTALKTTP